MTDNEEIAVVFEPNGNLIAPTHRSYSYAEALNCHDFDLYLQEDDPGTTSTTALSPKEEGFKYGRTLKMLLPWRPGKPKDPTVCPIDHSGFFCLLFYRWINPIISKAYRSSLEIQDVWACPETETSRTNTERFERLWDEEVEAKGNGASLTSVVWRFVRTRSIISTLLMVTAQFCEFLGVALALRYILEYVENSTTDLYYGLALAGGLFLGVFFRACFVSFVWYLTIRTGARLRAAILTTLFKKVLRVRNLKDKSAGEIVNICAADGQRIYDACVFVIIPMATPILAITCITYAILLVGPAALLGTAMFILFVPFQITLGKLTAKLREKVTDVTNQRVRMLHEMVQCIKLIKMYAWEKSFAKIIADVRKKERKILEKAGFVHVVSMGTSPMVSLLASVTTLTLITLTGNDITVSRAFTLTAIFDVMRFLIISTPFAIKSLVETKVSINRIQEILAMKDTEPIAGRPSDPLHAIAINQASFTWDNGDSENNNVRDERGGEKLLENGALFPNEEEAEDKQPFLCTLSGIDLVVEKGQLIGICGAVGCGKTSFISAILNEMRLVEGDIAVDGTFAYASQQPWIVNASVRDNIMFGNIFVREKYEKAIEACCLTQDLRILPNGDMTEIGERGINVSGGQKQRVSLARALYSDRDVYLLDDPLSAVDAHVGKHIFHQLIRDALRNKTVLFVTHQLQYLKECDLVLVMDSGEIVERGTHDELMDMGNIYAQLIKTFHSEEEDEEENFADSMPLTLEEMKELEKQLSNKFTYSTTSLASVRTVDTEIHEDHDVTGKLIHEEVMAEGRVGWKTYHGYVKAAGGYCLLLLIILTFTLTLGCVTFGMFWLSVWLRAGSGNTTVTVGNETYISNSLTDNPRLTFYTNIYGSSVVVMLVMILIKAALYIKFVLRASSKLHAGLFASIFRCPMSFFDTTPSGRILSRFAKDMDDIDVFLPVEVDLMLQYNIAIFLAIVVIVVVFPWLLIAVVVLGVVVVFVYQYFRHGVREMRRVEQVARSPWFSHITASVQGVTTIYAYGKQKDFEKRFQNLLDSTTTPLMLCQGIGRWAAVRLDLLTGLLMGLTGVLIIVLSEHLTAALAGLAIVCTSQITTYFQFCARMNAEVEARFTATERILEYSKDLPTEAPLTVDDNQPPPEWPSEGKVKFKDFKMRYRPNLPLVLKGINCSICPTEKIGIVGRTGSGKSSLVVALFRLVESSAGSIIIDGVDIGKIGLHDLRSKLSIIPQDPVLFIGTVRYNLDPFDLHTDDELWSALEKTYMKENISGLPQQLEALVIENGENFSVGERQLICMARALLRNSKILMLDEATAAIDTETDSLIQQTIKNSFQHCTMLTIAHRLNTVKNYDRIMVMDNGRVAEFDRPAVLMADPESMFSAMLAAAESHADD